MFNRLKAHHHIVAFILKRIGHFACVKNGHGQVNALDNVAIMPIWFFRVNRVAVIVDVAFERCIVQLAELRHGGAIL